jgi:hypothetical protein
MYASCDSLKTLSLLVRRYKKIISMKCVEFEETKHSASKKDKENHERMLPQRGGGGDAWAFPSYMINYRAKQNSGP